MSQLKAENHAKERIDSRQPRIYPVTEGIRSPHTGVIYERSFKRFLDYIKIHDRQVLLDFSPKVIKQMIIDYILYLRDDRRLICGTIRVHLAAILHFFQINNDDFNLTTRNFRIHLPSDDSIKDEDRPYTVEEIGQVLRDCDLRSKAAILLLCSTGMRMGALHSLQIGHLTEVNFQGSNLYKVQVYAGTRDRYWTFCTFECCRAIQDYLGYRERCGEKLQPKAPLIREQFNKDNPFTVNAPRFISDRAIEYLIDNVLKIAGVRKPGLIHMSHGFRKFFMTQCEKSGMRSINVKMFLGHDIGVSGHYYRPAESDILEDYMTNAADALTIDSKQRLQKKIEQLQVSEAQHLQDYEYVKKKMFEFQDRMAELEDQVRKPLTAEEYRKKYFEGENPVMDYQEHQDDNTLGRPKKNILEVPIGQKKPNGENPGKADEKSAERSFFEIE